MNTTPESLDALRREVTKAAESVASEWPGVIEADDAEQEIWGKLLESSRYVQQVLDMTAGERYRALRLIGHQVASVYRADYDAFTGQIFYCTQDVREILKRGVLTDRKYKTDTERMDLEEGLAALRERNKRYAEVIGEVFVLGNRVEDTKLITRAIDSLTRNMNRVHKIRHAIYEDGPGSRKAFSNSSAGIRTSHDYGGSYSASAVKSGYQIDARG